MAYIWPIALIVASNTIYHICCKSVPESMDTFASLTVTYFAGAVVCAVLYFLFSKGGNILTEYKKLNWAPIALGVAIVGLEAGYMFAYKAGWTVNSAQIVQSALLAVVLLAVGRLLYREPVTPTKIAGLVVCLGGLYLITR